MMSHIKGDYIFKNCVYNYLNRELCVPVKLRRIMGKNFSTSRYPIKSNYPPYEGEHCISRLQVLCNTARLNQ